MRTAHNATTRLQVESSKVSDTRGNAGRWRYSPREEGSQFCINLGEANIVWMRAEMNRLRYGCSVFQAQTIF